MRGGFTNREVGTGRNLCVTQKSRHLGHGGSFPGPHRYPAALPPQEDRRVGVTADGVCNVALHSDVYFHRLWPKGRTCKHAVSQ